MTHPEGNGAQYCYDANGNVLTTVSFSSNSGLANTAPLTNCSQYPTSHGDPNIVTTASYQLEANPNCAPAVCNALAWSVDAKGARTAYTVNSIGQVLTVTRPAGQNGIRPVTTYSYTSLQANVLNASGATVQENPISLLTGISTCNTTASCAGTADQTVVTIAYGVNQNLAPTSVTVAAGDNSISSVTSFTYDTYGNLASMVDARAGTTYYHYDADRRLIGVVAPDPDGSGPLTPAATKTVYDGDGRAIETYAGTVPSGSTSDWQNNFSSAMQGYTVYDLIGRVVQTSQAGSSLTSSMTQYQYDADNRLECTTVRMNASAFGSLSASQGGSPPTEACSLGPQGLDGPDRITERTYDNADEPLNVVQGRGTPASIYAARYLAYSANGLTQQVADGRGFTTSFCYDGFDRMAAIDYPDTASSTCAGSDVERFGYDLNANLASHTKRDGTVVSYSYDALNHLLGDGTTSYTYDDQGRLTEASAGSGASATSVTLGYDALGRKVSETPSYGGVVTSRYDAAGDRVRFCWSDHVCIVYAYDRTGKVTQINEDGVSSGPGVLASYTYTSLGQLTGASYGGGAIGQGFQYDNLGRLGIVGYGFPDSSQNDIMGLSFTADGRVRERANTNNAYDWSAGLSSSQSYGVSALNQLTRVGSASFAYDADGRLTSDGLNGYAYTVYDQLSDLDLTVGLSYDPLQRLTNVTQGSTTTRFAYDGAQISEAFDGSDKLDRRYVPGPDGTPLVWYECTAPTASTCGSPERRWMLKDPQGSVVAVANATQTAGILAINTYDAYGVGGAGNLGRFQYAGRPFIAEVGLYDNMARSYSPTLGRFLQPDPTGYSDGLNIYAYAHSDPVNGEDPTGTYSYCTAGYNAQTFTNGYLTVIFGNGPPACGSFGAASLGSPGVFNFHGNDPSVFGSIADIKRQLNAQYVYFKYVVKPQGMQQQAQHILCPSANVKNSLLYNVGDAVEISGNTAAAAGGAEAIVGAGLAGGGVAAGALGAPEVGIPVAGAGVLAFAQGSELIGQGALLATAGGLLKAAAGDGSAIA